MTFLPIVERELIEASRRRGTYWLRLAIAAVGLILGGWIMLVMRGAPPGTLGLALFVAISIAAYVYSLFIGIFRTADCLSEEKREGTLGLLFLTDLKGYDIVFGKLAATSLNSLYGILALFPIMAIPLLLGGVTLDEFWRVVLVTLNILFFSLSVGMFCSSISRDERRAMVTALLIVLFFAIGLPLLAGLAHEWSSATREYWQWVFAPSPTYAAYLAFDAVFTRTTPNYFTLSTLITHGLSWALLITASLVVPRTWQDKTLTAEAARRHERMNRLQLGSSDSRRRFRTRLLEINPFYWLVARHRTKPALVWAFLGLGALIWTLGLAFNSRDWLDEAAFVLTGLIVHTVIKFWVATEASRRFSLDRQSGALELLLSTPISIKEVLRGQWLGLERQFAAPVLIILLVDFVFLLGSRRETITVLFWIAIMIVLVADLITLIWLGMWRGLNSRRPNRAAAAALARVLFLPWGIFFLLMTLAALSDSLGRGGSPWNEYSVIIMGVVISLAVNLLFGIPARRNLLTRFREVATQRFEGRTTGKS
jgi:ABC-type transport system involved in multi-copper enzyme maturation permease subunit